MLGYKLVELYSEEELASSVKSVEEMFPEDIEHIRYTVKEDWTDDPAIFFRILLKDKGDVIAKAARRRDDSFRSVFAFTNRIRVASRGCRSSFARVFRFPISLGTTRDQRTLPGTEWLITMSCYLMPKTFSFSSPRIRQLSAAPSRPLIIRFFIF
jgi:hypothetical protein